MTTCIVEGCTKTCNRKYCSDHSRSHFCIAPGCKIKTHTKYCSMHAGRLHRTGELSLPTTLSSRPCRYCGNSFNRWYSGDRFCSMRRYFRAHLGAPEGPKHCWPWLLKPNTDGYGKANFRKQTDLAHRMAYRLLRGPIPDDMWVLHHCDNPICCNFEHLWLGTHDDNMEDMARKNRAHRATGMTNGQSKLTAQQVIEIYASRMARAMLAKKFNVTVALIRKVKTGQLWSRVTGHVNNSHRNPGGRLPRSKVAKAQRGMQTVPKASDKTENITGFRQSKLTMSAT